MVFFFSFLFMHVDVAKFYPKFLECQNLHGKKVLGGRAREQPQNLVEFLRIPENRERERDRENGTEHFSHCRSHSLPRHSEKIFVLSEILILNRRLYCFSDRDD
jgi:hypothetical protein